MKLMLTLMSLSPPMANGQCQGVEEHQVMQVALMTRLDEGLQANHVVLGGQLQGTVYLAPVVGVVSVGSRRSQTLREGSGAEGAGDSDK